MKKVDHDVFLVEYDALCKKHKMFIDSCGCCFGVAGFDERNDGTHELVLKMAGERVKFE